MAPARNLLRRHHDGCGGRFFSGGNPDYSFNQEKTSAVVLSSPMAEEEEDVGCSTASTTSKEEEVADHDPYKGWLQLSIAGHQPGDDPNNSTDLRTSSSSSRGRARSSELNLFPAERPPLPPMMMTSSSIFHDSVQPMITWGHRGPPPPPMTTGYSFSQVLGCPSSSSSGGGEFWVVSPPARPRTGVWFELKAAEIQGKQPFLPQIPKSYLRIKDGRMTVRLLMKYLANKLELGDESQIFPLSGRNPSSRVGFTLAFEWEKSHQQSCDAGTLREKFLQQSLDSEWRESLSGVSWMPEGESVLSPPSGKLPS